jgi:threonine/homoserine/homoserine lactone efflux protein
VTGQLGSYFGLVLLITLTPGIDTAVVTRSVVLRGQRAGVLTGIGCALGLFVHAAAVAVGAAALLQASAVAFEVIKLIGAAYLVLLGALALRDSWSRRNQQHQGQEKLPAMSWGRSWRQHPLLGGLLTNLTNPKASLFFLSVLPQFLPASPTAALPIAAMLAVVPVLASSTWLSAVALGLGRIRPLLIGGKVRRIQQRVVGVVLVGLGIRVAFE